MDNSTSRHSAGLIRNIIVSMILISAILACITIIINNTIPDSVEGEDKLSYSVDSFKSNATYIFAYDKYVELEEQKSLSNKEDVKESNDEPIEDINPDSEGSDVIDEEEGTSDPFAKTINNLPSDPVAQENSAQYQPTSNWWSYPANIYQTTRNGDDLLVLVNKQYRLDSGYYPSDLVDQGQTGIPDSGGKQGRAIMITQLTHMYNDAQAAGINLSILSGFRSYDTQVVTYNYWVSYNGGDIDYTDTISARPGHSQHQLGTAIDFGVYEDGYLQMWQDFNDSRAANWLAQNAWKYGFALSFPYGAESTTGFAYEGWHFRFIGVDNAANWHASGLLLEVWLRGVN